MELSGEISISPDDDILGWDATNDLIEVQLSGLFYDGDYREAVRLRFPLTSPPRAMSYDSNVDEWTQLDNLEPFANICEIHRKMNKHFCLQGFGADSGLWNSVGFVCETPQIFIDQ